MNANGIVRAGAVFGAVAAGAFGAHALAVRLDEKALGWWETAARYQLVHAVALLAIGALAAHGLRVRAAAWAIGIGVVLFCGTLYAMALGAPRWLGAVTPFGGGAMILGWLGLLGAGRGDQGAHG